MKMAIAFLLFFLGSIHHGASANELASKDSPQTVTKQKQASKLIVFIGDSLTEGYGVKREEAYPEKVRGILERKGHSVQVINAGISGSVSAEADRRVKWQLRAKPQILVLALGANDGLKGTPPAVVKKNLALAIDEAQKAGVQVLLAGIKVFTNFGASYAKEFEQIYPDLAREKKVRLMPFLLEGVALDKSLNLPDGKHPNAKGHEIIAENVAKELEKML